MRLEVGHLHVLSLLQMRIWTLMTVAAVHVLLLDAQHFFTCAVGSSLSRARGVEVSASR